MHKRILVEGGGIVDTGEALQTAGASRREKLIGEVPAATGVCHEPWWCLPEQLPGKVRPSVVSCARSKWFSFP